VVVVTVAVMLAAVTGASAQTVTYTFPADTNVQPFYRWTVPAGVCLATFDLYGAEGSGGVGGAHVTSTIAVEPGAPYDVYVGDWGYRGRGGYNGGGGASSGGVGGGGATDVRDGPGLLDRLLVAGGGGGNGGEGSELVGGMGGLGGLPGQDGTRVATPDSGRGGSGGTATAGGAAGDAGAGFRGEPGTLGVGGTGGAAYAENPNSGGGGGGGGLYGGGGGGGGGGRYSTPGGGGGGGSSLTAGGTVDPMAHGGKGMAVINFEPSSDCDAAGGAPGATLPLPTGTNPKAGIARVGTRLTLKGRYALVKLQCTQAGTCKGSLTLTTTGLPSAHKTRPAKAKQTKLGVAKFTIPALKTKTVKVKLSRTIRKRLAALSSRRLKRLKIVATAKVGGKTTKFSLGATRKH
jgi:hypothetical protein